MPLNFDLYDTDLRAPLRSLVYIKQNNEERHFENRAYGTLFKKETGPNEHKIGHPGRVTFRSRPRKAH